MSINRIADQQLLQATVGSLTATLHDSDGEVRASVGSLTVGVTTASGSSIVSAGSVTNGGTLGMSYGLTAALTADLDNLTASWTDTGDSSVHTSIAEIVGGYYFTVAELRAMESSLMSATTYTAAQVRAARREVEDEFERICGVAFVPRYRRVTLDGTGGQTLDLPDTMVRTVRSAWGYSDATNYTALTATELAALEVSLSGRVRRRDGGTFEYGSQNVVVEYEHGHDRPPSDLKRAAMLYCRIKLNLAKAGIPDRATSIVDETGTVTRIAQAGPNRTGYDLVDACLARYSLKPPGSA